MSEKNCQENSDWLNGLVSIHSITTKEEFDEMMSKEDERIRKYFEKKNLEKEQDE